MRLYSMPFYQTSKLLVGTIHASGRLQTLDLNKESELSKSLNQLLPIALKIIWELPCFLFGSDRPKQLHRTDPIISCLTKIKFVDYGFKIGSKISNISPSAAQINNLRTT